MPDKEIIEYQPVIRVEMKNWKVHFVKIPKGIKEQQALIEFNKKLKDNSHIVIWWIWVNCFSIEEFKIDKWDLDFLTLPQEILTKLKVKEKSFYQNLAKNPNKKTKLEWVQKLQNWEEI